jgi:hypothetical protein
MTLIIKDLGHFVLDQNGYLDPVVEGMDIDFGESNYFQDNQFLEIVTYHAIQFSFIIIHNTAWIYGPLMFDKMLGPTLDNYLNHYQQGIQITSPIKGQEQVRETLTLDYRNTHDPTMWFDSVMFYFAGEMFHQNKGCSDFNPEKFHALVIDHSYFVMTASAATCLSE